MSRRDLLVAGAGLAVGTVAVPLRDSLAAAADTSGEQNWLALLGRSEQGGRDYQPIVEGELPTDLRGSLYRNGPGRFERNGVRKRHLLDGDGLIQRLSFSDAGVRYQNAFVQTEKLEAEQVAGEYQHATWSTRRPGGFLFNLGGGDVVSQAGVTVYPIHGKLVARDEVGPSYELDKRSLATTGTLPIADGNSRIGYKAHSKLDPHTGEWIVIGQEFGPSMKIHVATHEPNFQLSGTFSFKSPRQVYIHDFFVTQSSIIINLHPCKFSPLKFLAGKKSMIDCLSWDASAGNLLAVLPRGGGEPTFYEAPAAFMWHALNAYDAGNEIVADFVGFDEPDHFIGKNAFLKTIMRGELGEPSAPGKLRRYLFDRRTAGVREEILDHSGHEFPMLDARLAMGPHRYGYFTAGGELPLGSQLKRVDYAKGISDVYEFGATTQVGEPVFVPRPGGDPDDGWLISQCLDGGTSKTFFAVLDSQSLASGPIAKIWLSHHVPLSFHGAFMSDA